MNSNVFCGARFAATLRRDWRMQRSAWGLRALGMLALMILGSLCVMWLGQINSQWREPAATASSEMQGQAVWGIVCFCLFTGLGASCFYQGNATPGQRMAQLLVPASTLEKWLSRFVIAIVGTTLGVWACWEVADLVRLLIDRHYYGASAAPHVSLVYCFRFMGEQIGNTGVLVAAMGMSMAMYMLGSTFFPRHPFLKTVGVCTVVEFIYGMALGYSTAFFMEGRTPRTDFIDDTFNSNSALLSDFWTWYIVIALLITAFCLPVSYMRMREAETIDRM